MAEKVSIIFLGCAGGRRVTFKQIRASGGILLKTEDEILHIDPGPAAFIRLIQIGIDIQQINYFALTHRHLDHSADINTLIEAKTMGGWIKGGTLIAPKDCLYGEDPIVFKYHRSNLDYIDTLEEGKSFALGKFKIQTPKKHIHHGVDTFGFKISIDNCTIAYITDARFTEDLIEAYSESDVVIANTTFMKPRELDHLSVKDAILIAKEIKPDLLIINHFGMEVLAARPDKVAKDIEDNTGIKTIAAKEFLKIEINKQKGTTTEKLKLTSPAGFARKWK